MSAGSESEPAASRALLDEIAPEFLARPGVDWGRMFSTEGLRVRGKNFAVVVHGGGLMVKVPEGRADELVESGSVERMVMRGRAMREWVVMQRAAGHDAWQSLVREAYVYLDEITP